MKASGHVDYVVCEGCHRLRYQRVQNGLLSRLWGLSCSCILLTRTREKYIPGRSRCQEMNMKFVHNIFMQRLRGTVHAIGLRLCCCDRCTHHTKLHVCSRLLYLLYTVSNGAAVSVYMQRAARILFVVVNFLTFGLCSWTKYSIHTLFLCGLIYLIILARTLI